MRKVWLKTKSLSISLDLSPNFSSKSPKRNNGASRHRRAGVSASKHMKANTTLKTPPLTNAPHQGRHQVRRRPLSENRRVVGRGQMFRRTLPWPLLRRLRWRGRGQSLRGALQNCRMARCRDVGRSRAASRADRRQVIQRQVCRACPSGTLELHQKTALKALARSESLNQFATEALAYA